jgi:hypothetical protein
VADGIGWHAAPLNGRLHCGGGQLRVGTSLSAPPKVPMAVRAVPTTKMSREVLGSSLLGLRDRKKQQRKKNSAPGEGRRLPISEGVNADTEVVGGSTGLKGSRLGVELARQVAVYGAAHRIPQPGSRQASSALAGAAREG